MLNSGLHRRIRFCFLLLVILAIMCCPPVHAEESVSEIIYSGRRQGFRFEPGSVYTDSDLFSAFKDVMPGDLRKQSIQFTNDAHDCSAVRLYVQAIPHSTDTNPVVMKQNAALAPWKGYADMQQFLSQMTLSVWNGDTLLSSDSADQTAGLAQPVLLGTFQPGETALLTVQLEVDPAMTSAYAHCAGEIDWQFLIECCDSPKPPEPSPHLSPKPFPIPDGDGTLIQTGLQNLPILVLAVLGIFLLVCGYLRRRHR